MSASKAIAYASTLLTHRVITCEKCGHCNDDSIVQLKMVNDKVPSSEHYLGYTFKTRCEICSTGK